MSVRLGRASIKAYNRGWVFVGMFVGVFIVSLLVLAYFDLLPEEKEVESASAAPASPLVVEWEPGAKVDAVIEDGDGELPVRVDIPAIGLSAKISNPTSTDIATLDKYLLSGGVRYPTSGRLGAPGNAVIFGHSSYLPIVSNKNFKAFNNIQKLKAGDVISVYGKEKVYKYRVESVVKADAESDAIPLSVDGSKLTLATCNSFGEKSDRFVVTAVLVESRVI